MRQKTKQLTRAALIAALYIALSYLHDFLLPGSASMAIQFRVSEALCVFALFTPSAIWGLTVGCMLFNLSGAGLLPLDFLIGAGATFLATGAMWLTRKWTIKGFPLLALLMPAVFNALIIGGELAFVIGGGFFLNAAYVAIGEVAVLLTLGSFLFYILKLRSLEKHLFE
jgi:uncharacterized membrane protein